MHWLGANLYYFSMLIVHFISETTEEATRKNELLRNKNFCPKSHFWDELKLIGFQKFSLKSGITGDFSILKLKIKFQSR